MSIGALLLVLLLMFSPLAPLVSGLLHAYTGSIEWFREQPPRLSFLEPGKDLAVKARLNGSHLVVRLSARNACRLYVYSSPPAWFFDPVKNKADTALVELVVMAEGDVGHGCRGANATISIPLGEKLLERFHLLSLLVNNKVAARIVLPGNRPLNNTLTGAYPFFDRDVRVSIKWARLYHGKLFVCLAVVHDGGGDYVALVDNPPDAYHVYTGKPAPVYAYKLKGITVVEIHLLALMDTLVLQSAVCTPISLSIELGGASTPVYVKVYVNGKLATAKPVAVEEPPTKCSGSCFSPS